MVRAPKRLIVTGARDVFEAHELFDRVDYHAEELLPFYDHYLKGIDNGYAERAPVKLYVRGDEVFRDEDEWPLARAEMTPYYLTRGPSGSLASLNDGGLSATAPAADGGATSHDYPDPEWKLGVVAMGPNGPDPKIGRASCWGRV